MWYDARCERHAFDEGTHTMKATRKQLARFRSLRARKGRRETGLFLLEGVRLCEQMLQMGVPVGMALESVLVSAQRRQDKRIAKLEREFEKAGVPVLHAPPHDVQRVSDTVHGQGIVAAARWSHVPFSSVLFQETATLLALDRIADPGNLGTIVRTAAWFGVGSVLLGRGCADLLNPKTVRATMGGLFSVLICRDVSLLDALARLKREGFRITVAAADGSPDWQTWAGARRSALVLGSEAHGVAPALRAQADRVAAIPQRGPVESLNVAVAAGVFLSVL